jgi:radical SAM-linked protein
MAQVICRYQKGREVKWISHLDLKRTLERAIRRAQLPVVLTQGHNPHLKLSFGPPLPLGATGQAELLTLHLSEALTPEQLKERLNAQLPAGLAVDEVWTVPAYRKRETFGDIDVAEYLVTLADGPDRDELQHRIDDLLSRDRITVERGGERARRTVELRPLILSLMVADSEDDTIILRMRLRTGSHGGARPQEVVALLGLVPEEQVASYHRAALYALPRPASTESPPRRRAWRRQRHPKGDRPVT